MGAGGHYHVHVRQVFEMESKLRIQNVVPLIIKSKAFGNISITKEDISAFTSEADENFDFEDSIFPGSLTECGIVSDDDIECIKENEWAPLVYVAGYSTYSLLKKIKCEYCKFYLTSSEAAEIDSSLISSMSRGGLCYPSQAVVQICSYAYVIVQKLLKKEEEFLQQKCQRQILSALIFNAIKGLDDIFIGHNNTCHTEEKLCKLLIKPLTNILLKNYIKKRNDTVSTKSMPDLKRFKVNTNKN